MGKYFILFLHWLVIAPSFAQDSNHVGYKSPLVTPAVASARAYTAPLTAVSGAGSRTVAVGQRGHIVYSDNGGESWVQASVPVSIDLTSVSFPTGKDGWASGHGDVVLRSTDGGKSWSKQLDSAETTALAIRYYEAPTGSEPAATAQRALSQVKRLVTEGSALSFLSVCFDNAKSGLVVGTFNQIFRTDDGGVHWTPWMHRIDNPKELHLYGTYCNGKETLISGEHGMVWRYEPRADRFVAMQTPYDGTLFGVLLHEGNIYAYGMRGTLLRSADTGATWEKIALPTMAGITGAAALGDGRVAFVTMAGEIFLIGDHDHTPSAATLKNRMSYYAVAPADHGRVVLVGSKGAMAEKVSPVTASKNP